MQLKHSLPLLTVLSVPLLMTGCASTSSELTYKAVAPAKPCKLASYSGIWQANPKVETRITTQSRMTNPQSEFTDAQQRNASFASFTLLGTLSRTLTESMSKRSTPNATPPKAICRLSVTPLTIVHDVRGGDEVVLESSVINASNDVIWRIDIKVIAPRSGQNPQIIERFTEKLTAELKADGFLD